MALSILDDLWEKSQNTFKVFTWINSGSVLIELNIEKSEVM